MGADDSGQPEDRATLERRRKAQEELAAMGAAQAGSQRLGRVVLLVLAVLFVGGGILLARYFADSVVESRYADAINEFMVDYKSLGKYQDSHHFDAAERLFDQVSSKKPEFAEPLIFQSAIRLLIYQKEAAKKGAAPPTQWLDDADKFAREALKVRLDYPDAHYYLAAVAFYRGDREGCKSSLTTCQDLTNRIYAGAVERKQQWSDKVSSARRTADDAKATSLDVLPILEMMPHFQLVKVD